jgi:RNA polymerase sigma-70 factor, ECF subfamily
MGRPGLPPGMSDIASHVIHHPDADGNATLLLLETSRGEGDAASRLAPIVYDSLRRLAADRLGRGDWTCQPTAIVHEAYLRLVDQSRVDWQGRTHFFAIGAEMIRRVIADEARRRGRQKRGGGWGRVTLDGAALERAETVIDPLDLEEALTRFSELDERAAKVVELRFFGGLTEAEAALALGVSERTVRNDWRTARAWLRRELAGGGDDAE